MAQAIRIEQRVAIRIEQRARRGRSRWARAAVAAAAALALLQQADLPTIASPAGPRAVRAAEVTAARTVAIETSVRPSEIGGSSGPALVSNPESVTPVLDVAAPAERIAPRVADPSPPAASGPARLTWRGTAGQEGYVRAGPTRAAAKIGQLEAGQPVEVVRWVGGEEVEKENTTWADLGAGRFVYSSLLRSRPIDGPPPPPADAPRSGKWIDVNLTLQVATAYEGTTPLRSALVSTGRPGWETPRGTFAVGRRVPKETMDGATLRGQGPNGRGATYKVENVRWTQYFTADGAAIHENYWRNPALFGLPGSHGCVGMLPADAAWFWDFATHGTPVVVH